MKKIFLDQELTSEMIERQIYTDPSFLFEMVWESTEGIKAEIIEQLKPIRMKFLKIAIDVVDKTYEYGRVHSHFHWFYSASDWSQMPNDGKMDLYRFTIDIENQIVDDIQ